MDKTTKNQILDLVKEIHVGMVSDTQLKTLAPKPITDNEPWSPPEELAEDIRLLVQIAKKAGHTSQRILREVCRRFF